MPAHNSKICTQIAHKIGVGYGLFAGSRGDKVTVISGYLLFSRRGKWESNPSLKFGAILSLTSVRRHANRIENPRPLSNSFYHLDWRMAGNAFMR